MRVRCLLSRSATLCHDPEVGDYVQEYNLTVGETYEVIGIEADSFRILNDSVDPCLYPADIFEVYEATRPAHWVSRHEDGVEYAYTPAFASPGFFEDYHDGDPAALRVFSRYINRHLDLTDQAPNRPS